MPSFSTRFQSSGSVLNYLNFQNHAIFKHENGYSHVRQFTNGAIQIQWSRSAYADWFSYSIINEECNTPVFELDTDIFALKGPLLANIETQTGIWSWGHKPNQIIGKLEDGLGFGWLGEKAIACLKTNPDEHFFGLGEKTGPLDRKGAAFTNWNTDAFAYADGRDPLYVSIPFYLVVCEGTCYGVFVDNSAKSHFNFGASNDRAVLITIENGPLNLILIPGPTPEEVVGRYSQLTGTTPMPPKWALGLQQCRYSYYPQYEVENLAFNFRKREIPADVIYLDIHYMDEFKVFSVDKTGFPNLKKLNTDMKKNGFRLVAIQDPGIKVEPGYPPFDSGTSEEIFVNYPDGEPWRANVWPGTCHFPDFTSEKSRNWWAELTANWINETGISGLWNDMNEPATWGQSAPDLLEFELEGRKGNHIEAHNVYGQLMAKSTRLGLLEADSKNRPFVLTRAGFAGIQRYAAIWTGDNVASEEHMFLGIRLVLGLGMSGAPFAGVDVGGFVGDSGANLFIRWISIAAFFPLFRIHSMIDSKDSESWTYGELAENISKNYIRLRYKLLPIIQTQFHKSSKTGQPILVPYFWRQPNFEYKKEFQHQFYLGDNLLVIPASSEQQAVLADIPLGSWRHLFTGEKITGGQTTWIGAPLHQLPVLIKEGSLLLTQKVGTHTMDPLAQDFQLHIFYGEQYSRLNWYDDDGLSIHPTDENRMEAEISFDSKTSQIHFQRINNAKKPWNVSRIFFWHFPKVNASKPKLTSNGKSYFLEPSEYSWLENMSNFDPFENKGAQYFNTCFAASISISSDNQVFDLSI